MAQKKITRDDLVAKDALTSITDEAEKLVDSFGRILEISKELVKNNPMQSGKDIKEYQRDVKIITKTTEEYNRVSDQLRKNTDEEVRGRLRLQRAAKQQRDELKDLIALEEREGETLEKVRVRSRQLRRERDQLNINTEEGRKRIAAINKELDKNNTIIKENSDAMKKQRLNVGNYSESMKEALNDTSLFGQSVGGLSQTLAGFANPLTAAVAGLTGLATAYASSTSGARDLRNAQSQLNFLYTGFGESLAELVGSTGDGQGLLSRFTSFVIGKFNPALGAQARIIANITDAQDELRVTQAEADKQAKELFRDAEKQRNIRDDELKSIEERIEANNRLYDIFNERERLQEAVLRERITQAQKAFLLDENNRDLQIEILQLETELADIQEENEGFRAEALANTNSLRRESIAIIKQQAKVLEDLGQVEDDDILKEAINSLKKVSTEVENERKETQITFEDEAQAGLDRMLNNFYTEQDAELDYQKKTNEKKKREQEEYRRQTIENAQDSLNILAGLISVFNASTGNSGNFSNSLVSGLSSAIQGSFYEGTENVSEALGKPVLKGRDGYIIRVDGQERILNPKQNSLIGDMTNDELANLAAAYRTGNLRSKEPINDERIVKRLDRLEKAVRDSKAEFHLSADFISEAEFKNGMKKIRKIKRPRIGN
jgi:hypothetical protein